MSSVFNQSSVLSGTSLFLYQNEEENVQTLINTSLQPYITTQQATNIFVNKTNFDASINQIVGEISILDNSLNNEIIKNNNQDISINNLQQQITAVDNSLNNIQNNIDASINQIVGEISILDNSLNNEIIKNNNQDISINNLQQQIININTDIDASLNTKVNNTGDTMTGTYFINNGKLGLSTISPAHTTRLLLHSNIDVDVNMNTYPLTIMNRTFVNNSTRTGIAFHTGTGSSTDRPTASIECLRTGGGAIGDLIFKTNSSSGNLEHMRILSNGNVGINQTSPLYTLDVNGEAFIGGDTIVNGKVIAGPPTAFNHLTTRQYVDDADNLKVSKAGDTMTGDLILSSNAKIGINTTTPETNIDVRGDILLKGNNRNLWFGSNNQFISASNGGVAGETYFGIRYIHDNQGGFGGDRLFFTGRRTQSNGNTDVNVDYITLLSTTGNVGINNTNPSERLDVNGNAILNGIRFTRASNIGYIQIPQSHDALRISPFQSISSLLEIRSNGNIGINNNNPQQRLDVNGNGVFSGTVSGATPTANNHLATKQYVDDFRTYFRNIGTFNGSNDGAFSNIIDLSFLPNGFYRVEWLMNITDLTLNNPKRVEGFFNGGTPNFVPFTTTRLPYNTISNSTEVDTVKIAGIVEKQASFSTFQLSLRIIRSGVGSFNLSSTLMFSYQRVQSF